MGLGVTLVYYNNPQCTMQFTDKWSHIDCQKLRQLHKKLIYIFFLSGLYLKKKEVQHATVV